MSNSVPVQQLFAGLEVHGEYVNGWATKYDNEHGELGFHCDKFSFSQQHHSIFTQGSSKLGKYIRFQECIPNGRWVDLWLPHGSLYSLSVHGAGADRPCNHHGHCVREASDVNGVSYLKHAVFQAQGTHSDVLEWQPKQGFTQEQGLLGLHSSLASLLVTVCNQHPPYPTALQVGNEECLGMSLSEKGKLGSFGLHGVWKLETPYNAEVFYEETVLQQFASQRSF